MDENGGEEWISIKKEYQEIKESIKECQRKKLQL
jgi:hypothetical protein